MMEAIELQSKTTVSAAHETDGKSSMDREQRDRAQLLRLGKRPVLKVPLIIPVVICLPAYTLISEHMALWLSSASQPPSSSPGRAFF